MKGVLLREAAMTLDGHPGRELLMRAGDKADAHFRMRMYLVGQRLYQLMAGGTEKAVAGPDVQRFLDSFRLLPAE